MGEKEIDHAIEARSLAAGCHRLPGEQDLKVWAQSLVYCRDGPGRDHNKKSMREVVSGRAEGKS